MENELLKKELVSLKSFIDTLSPHGVLHSELSGLLFKLDMSASQYTDQNSNMWTLKVKLSNSSDREVIRLPSDSTVR